MFSLTSSILKETTDKLVSCTRNRVVAFMEKYLFSSLHYFSVVKVVMHFIFQEERTVDEHDADRAASKKYVRFPLFVNQPRLVATRK